MLLGAALVAFALTVGERPALATGITMSVSLLCTIESFWIIHASRRGVVRRILSHWDQGYSTILLIGVFVISSILNTCTILTWITWDMMSGLFGESAFGRLLIQVPCTIPLLVFTSRVRRLEKLRGNHCTNCGYRLQDDSSRCPECGRR